MIHAAYVTIINRRNRHETPSVIAKRVARHLSAPDESFELSAVPDEGAVPSDDDSIVVRPVSGFRDGFGRPRCEPIGGKITSAIIFRFDDRVVRTASAVVERKPLRRWRAPVGVLFGQPSARVLADGK